MNLEHQVTNKEISQRLKELGVKQESLFEYRLFDMGGEMVWSKPILIGTIPKKMGAADVGFGECSAFTVAELGEMLPVSVRNNALLTSGKRLLGNKALWYLEYMSEETGLEQLLHEDTEADARGKMLIYLLENKLITF